MCSKLCKSKRDQRLRQVFWKTCQGEGCGKKFHTRSPEQAHCSRSCARRSRHAKPSTMHPCLVCEKPTSNSKYCSRVCTARGRTLETLTRWLDGNGPASGRLTPTIMRFLAQQVGNACQDCSWAGRSKVTGAPVLHVVRRDGNMTNTHKSNLAVLCPNDASVLGQATNATLVPYAP